MVQVDLIQKDLVTTKWVDNLPNLREGKYIELEKGDGRWRIEKIHDKVLDIEQLNSQRGFDNNNYDKHEGLFK